MSLPTVAVASNYKPMSLSCVPSLPLFPMYERAYVTSRYKNINLLDVAHHCCRQEMTSKILLHWTECVRVSGGGLRGFWRFLPYFLRCTLAWTTIIRLILLILIRWYLHKKSLQHLFSHTVLSCKESLSLDRGREREHPTRIVQVF